MDDRTRLMINVAKLYYEEGLTQKEISLKLRISRPTISRLMKDAIKYGIVKITISDQAESFADLEKQLSKTYGLEEVVVTRVSDVTSRAVVAEELGVTAAYYFSRSVRNGDVVGVTWGTTLSSMVNNLKATKAQQITVVQLMGGLGDPDVSLHGTDIVRRISFLLESTVRLMPAPGIVDSVEVARLLKSDNHISAALDAVANADIIFAGVGSLSKNALLVRDETIISGEEVKWLRDHGAVGEFALHFYDINGELVDSDLEKRIIGIGWDELKATNRVVAVAGGAEKIQAIYGALRGELVNVLITDHMTANGLLEFVGLG
jgi:DNA-binding transcriptional regulator LsrR (DeoR family)